jgi:four helix bundle protein
MKTHEELVVWQKSIELVKCVYQVTIEFPDTEKFGLTNQMRRSAVSVPSNIAEGHARNGDPEFKQFLKIAYGSSAELETQLHIARELEFISTSNFDRVHELLVEVRKMLNALIRTVASKS